MRSDQRHVDRRGFPDRCERVFQVIASSPSPTTAKAVHEKLQSRVTLKQVKSAIVGLRNTGRIEVVEQGAGHTSNTYRAVAERKVG